MLQKLNSLITLCFEEAAQASKEAAVSEDPTTRRDFHVPGNGWHTLACSQGFVGRLGHFLQIQRHAGGMGWHARTAASHGIERDRSAPVAGEPLISIVEDDRGVRESLQRLIRSLGYVGSTFATAEAYLGSDLLFDTSCLISDVQLPGMSGPDLQARLIADGYQIPIVFVTGFHNEANRARALAAGAVGYFTKPIDVVMLIECLEKALART